MGFTSFLGRVVFASLFILSSWQMFNDFCDEGGPAAKELDPKLAVLKNNLLTRFGIESPDLNSVHLVAIAITLKGIGGFLFVFGSSFGAYLLFIYLALSTPFLYDFYNYKPDGPEFVILLGEFLQSAALLGAVLFFLGMKNTIRRRQLKKKALKTKTT